MSTVSKSSAGPARVGPNGSDVANGLSAFGFPSILAFRGARQVLRKVLLRLARRGPDDKRE